MTRKLFTVALALLLALTALPVCVAESDLPLVTLDWYTDQLEMDDLLDTLAPGVKALFRDSVWDCMRGNGHCASQDEVREVLDEFVEKLKANGVETIVAEVQRQLDAWKAAR